jgi:hypothetical protein
MLGITPRNIQTTMQMLYNEDSPCWYSMNSLYKGNPSLDSYNMQMNQVVKTEQQAVTICNSISFITNYTAQTYM